MAPVAGRNRTVDTARIAGRDERRLVWSWHWIDGTFTADPYLSKFLQTKSKLLDESPAAAFVAVATGLEPGADRAQATLRDFLTSVQPLGPLLAGAAAR